MSEWPQQPRLSESLRQLGSQAQVNPEHRKSVLSSLGHAWPTNVENRRTRFGHARRLSYVLAAASVAVSLIAIGVVAERRSQHPIEAGENGNFPTTLMPSIRQPVVAAPELTSIDLCRPSEAGTADWAVTTDIDSQSTRTPVRVRTRYESVRPVSSIQLFFLTGAAPFGEATQPDLFHAPQEVWASLELPQMANADLAVAVTDRLIEQACGSASYLFIDENRSGHGDAIACRFPSTSQRYNGFIRLGDVPPPGQCEGTTPIMVVKTDATRDLDQWQTTFGCQEPVVTNEPNSQVELVNFGDCRRRLVLVGVGSRLDQIWSDAALTRFLLEVAFELH